jgi:putative ABC transport system substrate-binding protein
LPVSEIKNELRSRRELIKLVAIGLGLGSLAMPVCGAAQSKKAYTIGFLRGTSPRPFELNEFRGGLRALGYVEGEDFVIEQRYAQGALDRLPDLATELVRLKVDVIVVGGTHNAKAAKAATTAIPVVFTLAGDPVGGGLVVSLARPGGNVTGLSNRQSELWAKQLQLLKEAVPSVARIAVLWNPANPIHTVNLESVRAAARSLSVQLQFIEVRSPNEFAGAFAAITHGGAGALIALADPVFGTNPARLAKLAGENRLPAMFFEKEFVDAGALMSFGTNIANQFRRAAVYVDKILKGTKPSDLPVEQPTTFDIAVNIKAAKALGLTIPPEIMVQATRVIQ